MTQIRDEKTFQFLNIAMICQVLIFGRYQNCKLEVLDFDRCAGEFSNPRLLPLPQHAFGGGGVECAAHDSNIARRHGICQPQ